MPTIIQNASTSVNLLPGQWIQVTGIGIAVAQVGPTKGQPQSITNSGKVGPFDFAQVIGLTATRGSVEYIILEDWPDARAQLDTSGNPTGQIVTPSGDVVGGGGAQATNNYRLRLLVNNIPGVAVDTGGRGFNAYPGANNDVFRANVGYLSSKTATTAQDGTFKVGPQMLDWNFQTQSLIFSCRLKTATGSEQRVIGNASSSTVPGFALASRADGAMQFRISDGTTGFSGTHTTKLPFDGNEHHVVCMIDADSKVGFIWVDDDIKPTAIAITGVSGSTRNLTSPFSFGNAGSGTPTATLSAQFADIQIIVVDGGLPANYSSIRKMLQDDPSVLLTSADLPNRVIGSGDGVTPITANATAATRSLYRYLKGFTGSEKFLFGAHDRFDDPAYAPNAMGYLNVFESISGRKPAMMQWEYVDINQPDDGAGSTGLVRQPNLLAAMRAFAAQGGINFIHDHPGNPLTSNLSRSMVPNSATGGSSVGSSWDTTAGSLASLNTGGAQEAQFLAYLDRLAAFFQSFEYPIIYRPFHEANGDWFFWGGAANSTMFKAVWQKMVTYLRDTKGVTNVLFCWNLSGSHVAGAITDNGTQAYSQWWPGDGFVDVVSVDYYNESVWASSGVLWSLARNVLRDGMDAMNVLAAPGGKPVIFAEVGYPTASPNKVGLWELVGADMSEVYKDFSALLTWRAPWGPDASHASAPSLRVMMGKDYCITLDKSNGAAYTS